MANGVAKESVVEQDGASRRQTPFGSFPDISPAQLHSLEIICRAVAVKKIHLFKDQPAITLDDLVQTALFGAHNTAGGAVKAHHQYKPPTSYTSWIGKRANAAIIDLLRKSRRLSNGDTLGRNSHATLQTKHAEKPNIPEMNKIPKKLFSRGRTGHGGDAYAKAFAWGAEQGLNMRQTWLRLRFDTRLWLRIGFKQYPAWSSFANARQRLIKWSEAKQGKR